jgi:hypothetical protein
MRANPRAQFPVETGWLGFKIRTALLLDCKFDRAWMKRFAASRLAPQWRPAEMQVPLL